MNIAQTPTVHSALQRTWRYWRRTYSIPPPAVKRGGRTNSLAFELIARWRCWLSIRRWSSWWGVHASGVVWQPHAVYRRGSAQDLIYIHTYIYIHAVHDGDMPRIPMIFQHGSNTYGESSLPPPSKKKGSANGGHVQVRRCSLDRVDRLRALCLSSLHGNAWR